MPFILILLFLWFIHSSITVIGCHGKLLEKRIIVWSCCNKCQNLLHILKYYPPRQLKVSMTPFKSRHLSICALLLSWCLTYKDDKKRSQPPLVIVPPALLNTSSIWDIQTVAGVTELYCLGAELPLLLDHNSFSWGWCLRRFSSKFVVANRDVAAPIQVFFRLFHGRGWGVWLHLVPFCGQGTDDVVCPVTNKEMNSKIIAYWWLYRVKAPFRKQDGSTVKYKIRLTTIRHQLTYFPIGFDIPIRIRPS